MLNIKQHSMINCIKTEERSNNIHNNYRMMKNSLLCNINKYNNINNKYKINTCTDYTMKMLCYVGEDYNFNDGSHYM